MAYILKWDDGMTVASRAYTDDTDEVRRWLDDIGADWIGVIASWIDDGASDMDYTDIYDVLDCKDPQGKLLWMYLDMAWDWMEQCPGKGPYGPEGSPYFLQVMEADERWTDGCASRYGTTTRDRASSSTGAPTTGRTWNPR